ncbi:DNA repair protein RecO [Hyella patelloides LEGE 07179]|uniref:DNA repair protein RecO n=1 Tax=Hyella patelloides LEGE 07179 TaxID=945734 RepID=A0A563VPW4_9CYAN|nr:DNA repair protein RecO [Hyella patelloides]VEP13508.1 DNA repair protein RecO [Hyella patelloides LEGE 07179]
MPDRSSQYKATGIILKGATLKENDRLVTILTPDYGLLKAVAPGAKKIKSRLRGRTELFVINELSIVKGRSLDKIIQADTVYTYPGLSQDIGRLASAQYLGELAVYIAVDEQPQAELYELLNEHLRRIEKLQPQQNVYPNIVQGVFHLLAIAGIAPQVQACCVSNKTVSLNELSDGWRGGFSFDSGGVVFPNQQIETPEDEDSNAPPMTIQYKINAVELGILQHLSKHTLPNPSKLLPSHLKTSLSIDSAWIRIEQILRQYIKHHLGKSIRSANLVDNLYLVEF